MTMKNGDMPAMPVDRCDSDASEAGIQVFSGLTKREMMAMHMMAALMWQGGEFDSAQAQAECAIEATDALLAELERVK